MRNGALVLLSLVLLVAPACGSSGGLIDFPPQLFGINPTIGSVTGGTFVTLTGTNFAALTTVQIGGVPCTGVVVAPDGFSLTCFTGASSSGVKNVTVTTITGSDTLNNAYTYAIPLKPGASPYPLVDVVVEDDEGSPVVLWLDFLSETYAEGVWCADAAHAAERGASDDMIDVGGYLFGLDADFGAVYWYADSASVALGEPPAGCVVDERLKQGVRLLVSER